MPPAVVLLSGGLDSYTTAAVARRDGFTLYALSFRYGQRHAMELQAASRVARHLGVARHLILDLDLSRIGGSALTTPGAPATRAASSRRSLAPGTPTGASSSVRTSSGPRTAMRIQRR